MSLAALAVLAGCHWRGCHCVSSAQVPVSWERVSVAPVRHPDGRVTVPDEVIQSMERNKIGLKGERRCQPVPAAPGPLPPPPPGPLPPPPRPQARWRHRLAKEPSHST